MPKRKRRLAYARSGLMANFGGSKESEYWSFPLPPLSPRINAMKSSVSSADVRGHKSQVKVLTQGTPVYDDASLHAGLACLCPEQNEGFVLVELCIFFSANQRNDK